MNGSEVVKELRSPSIGEFLPTLFLTSLLDKKGQQSSYEEKTLRLEGVAYPALAKPFSPGVLIEVARRLAVSSTSEDSVQAEVEESIEEQVKEAGAAIESREVSPPAGKASKES